MRVVGLIAEYNPFHNGHKYHIKKAKELATADYAIVVMSGNFVQRGTPAIMPKHLRAEAALKCGADLVIELPVCYATGTAEQFAYGAVSLLDKLGCVDAICFGSECGDIEPLKSLAKILCDEPVEYKENLQFNLRSGMSFPLARQKAIQAVCDSSHLTELLEQPNNILGTEYLKALYRLGSNIDPLTIRREVSHYHDTELQEQFSSASALRGTISDGNFAPLYGQIPSECMPSLEDGYEVRYPVYANDFSLLLKYKLLNETSTFLLEYADVSEELANRICNRLNDYENFDQFCELLKTKEITYTRINRALTHILLGVKKSDYNEIEYVRVLGFRSSSSLLLSELKKSSSIPLLSKLGKNDTLSDSTRNMLEIDVFASNLYESVVTEKFKTPFINEFRQSIIKI